MFCISHENKVILNEINCDSLKRAFWSLGVNILLFRICNF